MPLTRPTRRVLLACVVSNLSFAAIGVGLTTSPSTPIATDETTTLRMPRHQASAPETVTSLTTAPPVADISPPQSTASATTRSPSTPSHSTGTAATSPAAAANDVTGIASAAGPPISSRIAPDPGSYPATFSGSASVNGRSQSFPPSGAVVFAGAGDELRQSAPNTPGDVVLTQRFSAAKSSLVSIQLEAGGDTKLFKPARPVNFLVYNAPQGTSWGWSANSNDGATALDASAQVVGSQVMHLDNEDVPVVQITTTITISGDISGTAELTAWVSPTYRLPLLVRQVINARAKSGYGLTTRLVSDVTQTLTALRPA